MEISGRRGINEEINLIFDMYKNNDYSIDIK
jgi:hypothetical protein